jgi:hypothetical protein
MKDETALIEKPQDAVINLQAYQDTRKQVLSFVKDELKEGTDYGAAYEGSKKPSLLKPGAEKICMLLQMEPVFIPDHDTWTMLGGIAGCVNLVCYLLTSDRKMRALKLIQDMGKENEATIFKMLAISEGRGAGTIKERSNMNANSLIKIVEKRSLVDAVLRVAGLSEMYTQDGEDTYNSESAPKLQTPSAQSHGGEWQEWHDAMLAIMDDNDWYGKVGKNDLDGIKRGFNYITKSLDIAGMKRLYDTYKVLLDTAKKQHEEAASG